ncbi:MAG TPA: TIGR03435 family protein [Bryobacteraceae bacterium]|jgi:uncharacterized protein (TIGR03435 family)
MRNTVAVAVLALLSCAGAFGQGFEAASIKPRPAASGYEGLKGNPEQIRATPGTLTATNASLRLAVGWAYEVRDFQIAAPAWLSSERYDITAKSAGPATEAELRRMLQGLLTERFKLALHREQRESQVYVLSTGKSGPRLEAAKGEGPGKMSVSDGALVFHDTSMPELAERLSGGLLRMDRPVVNTTDLEGRFDFRLQMAENNLELKKSMERGDRDPSFIAGLLDPLGLKLQPAKKPMEFLVIDRAEKIPSEN